MSHRQKNCCEYRTSFLSFYIHAANCKAPVYITHTRNLNIFLPVNLASSVLETFLLLLLFFYLIERERLDEKKETTTTPSPIPRVYLLILSDRRQRSSLHPNKKTQPSSPQKLHRPRSPRFRGWIASCSSSSSSKGCGSLNLIEVTSYFWDAARATRRTIFPT